MAWFEFIYEQYHKGKIKWEAALGQLGSFAKFDFFATEYMRGAIKPRDFDRLLLDTWMSSDPDDTHPGYLQVFQQAYMRNREKPLCDKPLPKSEGYLTIYHGQDRSAQSVGIAWTLDRNIARKFADGAWARMSGRDGIIFKGQIDVDLIYAYITERGESEVVCNPNYIVGVTREEM